MNNDNVSDFGKQAGFTEKDVEYLEDVMMRHLLTKLFGLPLVSGEDVQKILVLFDKLAATPDANVPEGVKAYAESMRQKYSVKPQNAPTSGTVQ